MDNHLVDVIIEQLLRDKVDVYMDACMVHIDIAESKATDWQEQAINKQHRHFIAYSVK